MCWTITMGRGKFDGRPFKTTCRAGGPPVDRRIATNWAVFRDWDGTNSFAGVAGWRMVLSRIPGGDSPRRLMTLTAAIVLIWWMRMVASILSGESALGGGT